jgi:hypothetical protein
MQIKYKLIRYILFVLLPLLIGGLIYISYRPTSLYMFSWFEVLGINEYTTTIRTLLEPYSNSLPFWIIYSLPHGLWVFSYMMFMGEFWNYNIKTNNVIWYILGPCMAIGGEIGQYILIVPGNYSFMDMFLRYTS